MYVSELTRPDSPRANSPTYRIGNHGTLIPRLGPEGISSRRSAPTLLSGLDQSICPWAREPDASWSKSVRVRGRASGSGRGRAMREVPVAVGTGKPPSPQSIMILSLIQDLCFDSLLKGVSLPATLYTLLNQRVRAQYAQHFITKDGRGTMRFVLRGPYN